jgi:hypothetical protein
VLATKADKSGAGHAQGGHIYCESHPITGTNRASTPTQECRNNTHIITALLTHPWVWSARLGSEHAVPA